MKIMTDRNTKILAYYDLYNIQLDFKRIIHNTLILCKLQTKPLYIQMYYLCI